MSDLRGLPDRVRKILHAGVVAERRRHAKARAAGLYWRNAYEELVRQTGRDLNDGLGRDPRCKEQK